MIIDLNKLDLALARCGKSLQELGIPIQTINNVKKGANVRPKTVHNFAKALECDVSDILKGGESHDS